MKSFISRLHSERFFHYIVSGGISFSLEFIIFFLFFYDVHLAAGIASGIGFSTGLVSSFLLNRLWVFPAKADRWSSRQISIFLMLGLFNLTFTSLFVQYLVSLQLPGYFAKFCAMVLVVIWNFILFKKIIFKQ